MTTQLLVDRSELEALLKSWAQRARDHRSDTQANIFRDCKWELEQLLSRTTPSAESDISIIMDRDAWRAAMIGLCQGPMKDVGTPDKAADHLRKRLTKATPSTQAVTEVEVPMGAIENGRVFADRLEQTDLSCIAGDLHLCVDWHEFRRCFEHLADWATHLPLDSFAQSRGAVGKVSAEDIEQLKACAKEHGEVARHYVTGPYLNAEANYRKHYDFQFAIDHAVAALSAAPRHQEKGYDDA